MRVRSLKPGGERRVWIAALALVLALGACAAPAGTGNTPTPTSVGATVTIAPSITPRLTAPPPARPDQTPTPPAELPLEAPAVSDVADVVGGYLSRGGDVEGLVEALRYWGMHTDEVGGVWDDVDLDGDGREDLVLSLLDPAPLESSAMPLLPPGVLLAYVRHADGVRLVHRAAPGVGVSIPSVLAADDLNADGRDDLLYTTRQCGAHTCFLDLHGYRWADEGELVSLLAEPVSEPYAEYRVHRDDGDGVHEIIADVGMIGSAGAGPQRTFRRTYAWDGDAYVLRDERATSPAHPIHVLHDADALMAEGRYVEAAAEFGRSYADPSLDRSWPGPEGWGEALEAYARYRIVVAHAARGDADAARAAHEALRSEIQSGQWTDIWLWSAEAFWEAYADTGNAVEGCDAVLRFVLPGDLAGPVILNEFGYANRTYLPEDLCALGTQG